MLCFYILQGDVKMLSRFIKKIGSLSAQTVADEWLSRLYHRWKRRFNGQPVSMPGYIYKAARIRGTSEYEVFCKAAESWPVSDRKIEQDFKTYLLDQHVPYYVADFIRKHQKYLDELHIPLF